MATVTALDVRVAQAERRPDLGRFVAVLTNLSKALEDVDRTTTPGRIRRPRWVVEDLRHHADFFHVQLTAADMKGRDRESLLKPAAVLVTGVRSLREHAELPPFYNEVTVERLLKVAKPMDGIREVSLATINGKVGSYESLDDTVVDHARAAVRGVEVSIGSVSGTLTRLQTSATGLRVTVFDPVARRHVNGTASLSQAEDLRPCWNHRVSLRGRITRNSVGQALRIAVSSVERLPEERRNLQVAQALYGADPKWTSGQSVEDFLDHARRRRA